MAIIGAENLSDAEIKGELQRGARLVVFEYCVSVLIMTFKRSTDIHLVRPGESAVMKGLPWTLLSLLFGWWGFPWGLIYTPCCGGRFFVTAHCKAPEGVWSTTVLETAANARQRREERRAEFKSRLAWLERAGV